MLKFACKSSEYIVSICQNLIANYIFVKPINFFIIFKTHINIHIGLSLSLSLFLIGQLDRFKYILY